MIEMYQVAMEIMIPRAFAWSFSSLIAMYGLDKLERSSFFGREAIDGWIWG